MLRQYVQKIVSRISNSNGSGLKSRARKPLRERSLRLERLEDRALLSVSTAEYAEIRATYPDMELPENVGKINVVDVEITEDSAESLANLKAAIDVATASDKPDLIVVRTSESANTINYASFDDAISIKANESDTINIVAFGDKPLTINANNQSTVLTLNRGNLGVANLTITGGYSVWAGGGVMNYGAFTAINTTISGNATLAFGGGIYTTNKSFTAINTTISNNSAQAGGGIYRSDGDFIAIKTVISNNSAVKQGGGVFNSSRDGQTVTTNTLISGNKVIEVGEGGGVYNHGDITTIQTTIAGNSALTGGGVYNMGKSFAAINTIIARQEKGSDVTDNSINFTGYNSLSTYTYKWKECSGCQEDNRTDQLFKDAENGDYSLTETASQAIDKGDNAYVDGTLEGYQKLETDFAGNPRIVYGTVDIGAYEYSKTITVDASFGFAALTQAIENASNGDTIKFAESATPQTVSFADTIALEKSITLDGTGANVAFDGGGATRLFNVSEGAALTLKSVTLQNGKGDKGGAIRNAGTLTLNGVAFANNVSTNIGGAVYNDITGTLTMRGDTTTFVGNTSNKGGAIANYGTTTLKVGAKATFTDNSATQYGGAYFGCGTLNVEGMAVFNDNKATADGSKGGAIYSGVYRFDESTTYRGQISITGGASFDGNYAQCRGGAIMVYGDPSQDYISLNIFGVASFTNNAALAADSYGGAIDVGMSAKARFTGTLFFAGNGNVEVLGESYVSSYGGAIFSAGSLSFDQDGTYMFINNESSRSGGAIDACNYEETPGDDYVAGLLAFSGDFFFDGNRTFGTVPAGLGGAIATAAPTKVDNATFSYRNNEALRGNCVAVDTCSVDFNKNLLPQDFGLEEGNSDDYSTFKVLKQRSSSATAPITPASIAPKAVAATITVEGVTKTFGAEGVAPQELGLDAGVYEALVQYEDADGIKSAVYSLVLTVDKGASLNVRETSIANGRGVKFNFNLNKDGRAVSVWEISWGDGTTTRSEKLSSSWMAAHYYAKDGVFNVSLTAVYLDGTSESFEGFSTQKIGKTTEPEVLATCFNEIDDVFYALENLVPYGPTPRKR